jgi:hypothetical protein
MLPKGEGDVNTIKQMNKEGDSTVDETYNSIHAGTSPQAKGSSVDKGINQRSN